MAIQRCSLPEDLIYSRFQGWQLEGNAFAEGGALAYAVARQAYFHALTRAWTAGDLQPYVGERDSIHELEMQLGGRTLKHYIMIGHCLRQTHVRSHPGRIKAGNEQQQNRSADSQHKGVIIAAAGKP